MPECVNVESPMQATAGVSPASEAPMAMVIDAPMSTVLFIDSSGGIALRV